ncbi:hypothetical protein [Bacillus sp. Marseille-P3800]|uniref:hypothetical protein n=1 Tax=Bacillus sp. Marseille-P3800 TaxID=2014782 RepID=UPI000C088329|nr:hypothetical protein [Bacillus sp. Marseille-P3800]
MTRPMFKDYDSEEEALKAANQMKLKYDTAYINVIAPFPESDQTKTYEDYGLPKNNVKYDGDVNSLVDSLEGCGFNEEQAKILRDNIESGQVLVVICESS